MSDSSTYNYALLAPYVSTRELLKDEAFCATHPWIQHYEQGVPARVTIPDLPLTWLIDRAYACYPDHTACFYYGTKLTYARLFHSATHFAGVLQRLGVKKGDRVAIVLPNIPQYPIAFYGALKAGAVVVPTNPLYKEREMQYQLADSGARVIVMLDTFYPIVRAIRAQTALKHVIITDPADYLPPTLRVLYPFEQWRTRQLEPRLTHKEIRDDQTLHVMTVPQESSAEDEAVALVPVEATDLAVLQYTGGTTGLSKGAMLTHKNLLANAIQIRSWFSKIHDGEETVLCVAPFFHAYGMSGGMNISILLAATMALLPHFKTKEVVNAIRHAHPTLFPGIPTMYLAVTRSAGKHPDDFQSIKYCISGAAPLPAQVQSNFEAITHSTLVEGYGLSEASPVTHCNPLTEACRNGSIGLPLPNVEAAIVDQVTGEPVPVGTEGELVVKGPNIMQGYWNREEETQAMFHNGWMRTGDLGKMDADGYFYIVERIKDVIITGGFKVFPREVEEVLFQHPTVAEAAVAGMPDAYRGETVAAFVVLKAGVNASEATRHELIQFCAQRLVHYKVPKHLEFRADLPKSLIGKVLRRELRADSLPPTTAHTPDPESTTASLWGG